MMPMPDKEVVQSTLKATNENLFKEFLEFCGSETAEHPEVISFLQGRHQKANPDFLASTEFRNVIGRCLTRVQSKKSKVYVYINELCTVLKSNSEKKKVALSSAPPASAKNKSSRAPRGDAPADDESAERPTEEGDEPAAAEDTAEETAAQRKGSKRQIRYLENLLSVYTAEIRKLQEKDLDLKELESEDSTYIQENRLKRKMIRIFEKLCELKHCCSRTGRVIEQRIPYLGTRYPEVNKRIQKFINKPDNFPDYGDIFKVIEKASIRHDLDLTKRQMQSMAADAFREVGNRLQERRHLDMVYNFGNHLTDKYKAGTDPALQDPVLARRLRENRSVALTHLDEVVKKYAELQDETEEEDRQRRRGNTAITTRTGSGRASRASAASTSASNDRDSDEDDDDDDDDDEEEDDDDETSSETDIDEELQKCEAMSEPEEEGAEEEPVPEVTEGDQRMGDPSEPSPFSSAGDEVEDDDDDDDDDEDEEDEDEDDEEGSVKNGDDQEHEDDPGAFSKPDTPESRATENKDKSVGHEGATEEALKGDTPTSGAMEGEEPMELETNSADLPGQDPPGTSATENAEEMETNPTEVAAPGPLVSSDPTEAAAPGPLVSSDPTEAAAPSPLVSSANVDNEEPIDCESDSGAGNASLAQGPQSNDASSPSQEEFALEIERVCVSLSPEADCPRETSTEPADSPAQSAAATLSIEPKTLAAYAATEGCLTSSAISQGTSPGPMGFPRTSPSPNCNDPEVVSQESGGSRSSRPASPVSQSMPVPGQSPATSLKSAPDKVQQELPASDESSEPPSASQTSPEFSPGLFTSEPASPSALTSQVLGPSESQAGSLAPATSRSSPVSTRPPGPLSQRSLESEVALSIPLGSPVAYPRPQVASPKTSESAAPSPKPSVSCVASPVHPGSNTASPKPSCSQVSSPCPSASRDSELQATSPGQTRSPFSAVSVSPRLLGSYTASPGPAGSRAASPGPAGSRAASPGSGGSRAASPKSSGQLPPRSPVSGADTPECSRSPSSAAYGSPEASPGPCNSPEAYLESSRSPIRSATSLFHSAASGLDESGLCSRTNSSSSSSDSVVDLDMVSSASHRSGGAGVTDISLPAPTESGLGGDACRVTSSGLQGSMQGSKDDCVLLEQTDVPRAELLCPGAVSGDPKVFNEALPRLPTRSASVTSSNSTSASPAMAPVKRKRTLSGTLKTLQLRQDAATQQNGRASSTASVNGGGDSFLQCNHHPKRPKREDSYLSSRFVEVHSINSDSDDDKNVSLDLHVSCVSPDSPSPRVDSTQNDTPFLSIVTSSPLAAKQQSKIRKINASTQCDPEEVIVLSDSD